MDRRWLAGREPDPRAEFRLFCLPYAGGSAAVFRGWQEAAPAGMQVCPIELPGRGARYGEPPFHRVRPLVASLAGALDDAVDRPFALFGHSMGALLVFELARTFRRRGSPEPVRLFVSGASAPDSPHPHPPLHSAPPEHLRRRLRELNGTPRELLENDELMELMLPVLLADFAVVETYEYQPEPPLAMPVSVFAGNADDSVPASTLPGWRKQTRSGSRLRVFDGGHFFLRKSSAEVFDAVLTDLADHSAETAPSARPDPQ